MAIAPSPHPHSKQPNSKQPPFWRIAVVFIIALSLVGCTSRAPSVQVFELPEVPTITEPHQLTSGSKGTLVEVAPPAVLLDLNELIENKRPRVSITSPKADQVIDSTTLTANIQLRGLSIYKEEKTGLGPHLQISLDNRPAQSVYDLDEPVEFTDLEPGTHTLRAIATKPWGESFKNTEAFAETTFHIFAPNQSNAPDPEQPELIYSQPQGTYSAEPVLLDFYLNNAPLHLIAAEDDTLLDWKIRCDINGQSFTFDQWQPIYLKGFTPGQNWVRLTLIDAEGNAIPNTFNSTVRLINYDPQQQTTLSQLMRGELPLRDVGKIVEPNYVPPAIPEPLPEPVQLEQPEEINSVTQEESSDQDVVEQPLKEELEEAEDIKEAEDIEEAEDIRAVGIKKETDFEREDSEKEKETVELETGLTTEPALTTFDRFSEERITAEPNENSLQENSTLTTEETVKGTPEETIEEFLEEVMGEDAEPATEPETTEPQVVESEITETETIDAEASDLETVDSETIDLEAIDAETFMRESKREPSEATLENEESALERLEDSELDNTSLDETVIEPTPSDSEAKDTDTASKSNSFFKRIQSVFEQLSKPQAAVESSTPTVESSTPTVETTANIEPVESEPLNKLTQNSLASEELVDNREALLLNKDAIDRDESNSNSSNNAGAKQYELIPESLSAPAEPNDE